MSTLVLKLPESPSLIDDDGTDEVRPGHTEERRRELASVAANPIPWHEDPGRWIDGDVAVLDANRRLLFSLDRYQNALRPRKVCRSGGDYRSVVNGLAALAFHHRRWIRPPETWRSVVPKQGHPQRIDQFSSLARHLLTQYPVPSFMDEVWFIPKGEEALRRQEWFLRLGSGDRVRDLDLPIILTRRMAHRFMEGKNRDSIDHNLRWAQVVSMGGEAKMARTILSTRLGRHLDHDEFWSTVVLFLATNPLIDPAQIGPMVDYVHNIRFAPRRVVAEGGGVAEAPPPQPDFTMKHRSAVKLLRQVDAWHGHLTRVQDVLFQSWQPGGLRPFELEEETPALGPLRWTVQELLSSWELAAEGAAMGHCVVSYSDQCADGHTSIWSIGAQVPGEETRENVLTVAVDVKRRAVTQARGRHNMLPHQAPRSAQAQVAAGGKYKPLIDCSDRILRLWMERERLRRED